MQNEDVEGRGCVRKGSAKIPVPRTLDPPRRCQGLPGLPPNSPRISPRVSHRTNMTPDGATDFKPGRQTSQGG